VAETSNLGLDVDDGPRRLDRLVAGIDRLRADDLPVHGICWYSRGDQYDWQTMLTRPVGDVINVGFRRRPRGPPRGGPIRRPRRQSLTLPGPR
jgi:hypothetical protein